MIRAIYFTHSSDVFLYLKLTYFAFNGIFTYRFREDYFKVHDIHEMGGGTMGVDQRLISMNKCDLNLSARKSNKIADGLSNPI